MIYRVSTESENSMFTSSVYQHEGVANTKVTLEKGHVEVLNVVCNVVS